MNHSLWIKHTLQPKHECASRLKCLAGHYLVDNRIDKFHLECKLCDGFEIGPGEFFVCQIYNDGSDDGSKTCTQPDESLMPFFAPTDGEEPHKFGPGQCQQHALLIKILPRALDCKFLCCCPFVSLATA